MGSLTQGAGQFCTNPGLLIARQGEPLDRFLAEAARLLERSPAQTMLTPAIHRAYVAGVRALAGNGKARLVMRGAESLGPNQGQAHLFVARAEDFLADPRLQGGVRRRLAGRAVR